MSGKTKIEKEKLALKHWSVTEELLGDQVFVLDASGILRIYSSVDFEECRKLLRAIVHSWLHLELARNQIPRDNHEYWHREKKLLINYRSLAIYEWSWELQEVANLYQHYEGRQPHYAELHIMGNIWRFDASLKRNF